MQKDDHTIPDQTTSHHTTPHHTKPHHTKPHHTKPHTTPRHHGHHGKEDVGVFARLKPTQNQAAEILVAERFGKQKSVRLADPAAGKSLEFTLDWIFKAEASQEEVYRKAGTYGVDSVLAGFNATLLCYGQTGAGKTHTMFGPDKVITDFDSCDPADWGIVPRATEQIFQAVTAAEGSTIEVQCSYLEVYNERVNCLLGGAQHMALYERKEGILVDGLMKKSVTSSKAVMRELHHGNDRRIVAPMKMNLRSSRGHGIFTFHVNAVTTE